MPTETSESVLDAINDALGESGAEPVETEVPAEATEGSGEESQTEGTDAGTQEGEQTGEDAEGKGDEEIEIGPDGKPIEAKKPEAEPARPPDPLNDPIPKDLAQPTQQRIRSLIKTAKEVTAERDTIQGNLNEIVGGLRAANISPAQYGEIVSWFALFNSGDVAQQEKALELGEQLMDQLATLLGRERKVPDPLSAHPDLQQLVQQQKTTREIAVQLAIQRNSQKFRTTVQTQASQTAQTQQQQEQALTQARTELTALGNELQQRDPRYAEKKALLVPALREAFKSMPPAQWAPTFRNAYNALKLPARSGPVGVPAQQPLRAKQPAGGGRPAPASALDAMNEALSSMKG